MPPRRPNTFDGTRSPYGVRMDATSRPRRCFDNLAAAFTQSTTKACMRDEVKSIKSGPYTLVARLYEGRYHGFLWEGGKVVENDAADSLSAAWARVCSRLYERLSQAAQARGADASNATEARNAFLAVHPRLSVGQKAMLRAHLDAPDRCLTATQLSKAAGYRGYAAANLQYGLLGAMLYGEMPQFLPLRRDGSPIMTFMIASGENEEQRPEREWIWKMRHSIAVGLREARILA